MLDILNQIVMELSTNPALAVVASLCCGGIFLIIAAVLITLLVRRSSRDAKAAEIAFNQQLQSLPADKQLVFVTQYNNLKKSPTTAVLLAFFLGGVGAHKFYLGRIGLGIVYLVFFWTGIPALIGFIEAFLISGQVVRQNARKAAELAAILNGTIPAQFVQ